MDIEIRALSKKYKDQLVLNNINLDLSSGRIYGIIGRNGSGKTVLFKSIAGLIRPTSGYVKVDSKIVGKDMDFIESCGLIIENPGFLSNYSALNNLKMLAAIKGKVKKDEIKKYIAKVGLDPNSKKHVGKFSMGMKQRLAIAQAIMEDPDLIILDEPLNGLDNEGVKEMRELFLELKAQGKLIIMCSHNPEDIEILADEIWRMDKGEIVKQEKM